jgi:hypothetical protein
VVSLQRRARHVLLSAVLPYFIVTTSAAFAYAEAPHEPGSRLQILTGKLQLPAGIV